METAVEAMRAGAYDFVTKPFDIDALEVEKRYILKVMQAAADDKSLAAHTLGIGRRDALPQARRMRRRSSRRLEWLRRRIRGSIWHNASKRGTCGRRCDRALDGVLVPA